jgi:hypothetical protein
LEEFFAYLSMRVFDFLSKISTSWLCDSHDDVLSSRLPCRLTWNNRKADEKPTKNRAKIKYFRRTLT